MSGQRIGLGGGCHWCTEAVFQSLKGVERVEQGFIRSLPPHESWSEAVIVHFDSGLIGLRSLIDIHLRTHASTSNHSMRGKYRSAVYAFDDEQFEPAQELLTHLASGFDEPLVTNALLFKGFKPSDERFHNYYETDPQRPFCRAYIDPKLKLLRERFAKSLA
ncbi:MAG: peptide-methionine (S)-S-oxide reductase [Ahrensia sp.]|nr:peptide-methionine (S)-S-oxide reductase [Ahrensia sp.]